MEFYKNCFFYSLSVKLLENIGFFGGFFKVGILACTGRKQRNRTMTNVRLSTLEECVIAPVFEKTDSLTGDQLHVNDDSILSEVGQDDGR